ncbi:hypothetical protein OG694_40030 [Streptomyces sp. NBC_00906]|nr:hypothetical protein [Streptomyces sp. NBC_00906]MCX4901230.1 hypothetical protein [Streptomyces sp. NBC_00892]
MEMRWERAVADGLPTDVPNAFGIFDKTLCGIQETGMSPSDHRWLPEQASACGACREAAGGLGIDAQSGAVVDGLGAAAGVGPCLDDGGVVGSE